MHLFPSEGNNADNLSTVCEKDCGINEEEECESLFLHFFPVEETKRLTPEQSENDCGINEEECASHLCIFFLVEETKRLTPEQSVKMTVRQGTYHCNLTNRVTFCLKVDFTILRQGEQN